MESLVLTMNSLNELLNDRAKKRMQTAVTDQLMHGAIKLVHMSQAGKTAEEMASYMETAAALVIESVNDYNKMTKPKETTE